jgi:hypothetical protein
MRLWRGKLPQNYQEQTYASPHLIVRYPHRKRIAMGVHAASHGNPSAVLDYGAGDGKVLIEALEGHLLPDVQVVAYEPIARYQDQIRDGAQAAGVADRIEIVSDRSMLLGRSFDRVLCLSVLEHMPISERVAFYDLCDAVVTDEGRIVVDIPVEIGPTLLVKVLARRTIKGRAKEWGNLDLLRASLGAIVFDPARFDPANDATWIHDHRGFDYRLLRREACARFDLVTQTATPMGLLPAPLGNQEAFLTFKRLANLEDRVRHNPRVSSIA